MLIQNDCNFGLLQNYTRFPWKSVSHLHWTFCIGMSILKASRVHSARQISVVTNRFRHIKASVLHRIGCTPFLYISITSIGAGPVFLPGMENLEIPSSGLHPFPGFRSSSSALGGKLKARQVWYNKLFPVSVEIAHVISEVTRCPIVRLSVHQKRGDNVHRSGFDLHTIVRTMCTLNKQQSESTKCFSHHWHYYYSYRHYYCNRGQ